MGFYSGPAESMTVDLATGRFMSLDHRGPAARARG